MKLISALLIATLSLTLGVNPAFAKNKKEVNVKQQVKELLQSIETGDQKPVSYINPKKYIQHNLAVADGLEGFGQALSALPKGSGKASVKRVFQDGNYVFAHTEYDFFGPKIGVDIFRFEEGLIVEHWDNLQAISESTVSGRTQIDGPTEVTDIHKTEENKALVKELIDTVFLGGNADKVTNYISTEKYHQHNPNVADGLDALGKALSDMAKAGTPMVYTRNHLILGEGNFVLAVSEGLVFNKHVSFYDLFRIEDGKIVEHWDTVEEIPLRNEWKNQNGKFGFPENRDERIEVIGNQWLVDFPGSPFKLDFHSETSMTFYPIKEDGSYGDSMKVDIERIEIRPNVYMVTWGEPSVGISVVHLQDYENAQVWTNIIFTEENKFLKLTGKLLPYIAK